MTLALRATPALITTTTTTLPLIVPASAVVGDYLYMLAGSGPQSLAVPSGWESAGNTVAAFNANGMVAVRVCQAGDIGATVNVTASATGRQTGCIVAVESTLGASLGFVSRAANVSGDFTVPVAFPAGGGLALYFGNARVASSTVSLSRGTTDSQRTADTLNSFVVGHESVVTDLVSVQTFSPAPASTAHYGTVLSITELPVAMQVDVLGLVAPAVVGSFTGHVYKGRLTKAADTSGVA